MISYLLARGRCCTCRRPIDPVHPIMEIGCSLLAAVAAALLPWPQALAIGAASLLLLTLAALDLRHFWLPNALTLSLAIAGLAVASFMPPPLLDRAIGLIAGWVSLTAIAWGYRRWRGREGLGGGDPKLLAAIGAWTGWVALPFVLLGASVTGLVAVGCMLLAGRRVSADTRLPFGTLLAVAAIPALYWTALG